MYVTQETPSSTTFLSCQFIANSISYSSSLTTVPTVGGGAVSLLSTAPTFRLRAVFISCLFTQNSVSSNISSSGTVAQGGAVYSSAFNTTFTLCRYPTTQRNQPWRGVFPPLSRL